VDKHEFLFSYKFSVILSENNKIWALLTSYPVSDFLSIRF